MPSDEEWEKIAVVAIAVGLAPLLYRQLTEINLDLPPMARAKLAVLRKAHAKRNQEIADQLAEILAACTRENIAVIVLKGALLAPTVYDEPALRPMNDIDLLFRAEDIDQAGAVLEALGYSGKYKDPDLGPGVVKHVSTYRRAGNEGSTPNPFLSTEADRMVEPHISLEEAWFGLKVDVTPGVWERAVPIVLNHQPALRLSTTDLLIHLAVHATFHVIMGSSVFLQLYDIGQVLQVWGEEIKWSELLHRVRQSKAQPFVYAGFYWAKSLYNASIPEISLAALAQNCSPALVAYVQSLSASGLLRRTQHPPLVTFQQRLQRGLLDRKEAARWAASFNAKWQVWQTALTFYKTDTMNLLKQRLKSEA
ncbi:MAG: nucleotidyltransferase family protein [Anaerolineaceae bacterium]|nr:nucleotidyltransferase family protein [Anaerolineaceae bacterium]